VCQVGEEECAGRTGVTSLLLSGLGHGASLEVSTAIVLYLKIHVS
jgi:hypothetical protein